MRAAFLIIGVVLVLLGGCTSRPESSPSDSTVLTFWDNLSGGLYRKVDCQAKTVCYLYKAGYSGGISCLPVSATSIDIKAACP